MLQAASATSGKYRFRSCPDFEVIARSFPARERMQRNPSHFGSYCHCEPAGISLTERASIGAGALLLIAHQTPSVSSPECSTSKDLPYPPKSNGRQRRMV